MVKDLFRIIGAACILTGISLYFSFGMPSDDKLTDQNKALTEDMAALQEKLQKTEEELAHLQTLGVEATTSDEKKSEEPTENDPVQLTIEIGTTSKDVAEELANAGIIEDAEAFNQYLTDNQFAKNIQIGEYEIHDTMNEASIAKLITTLID